MIKIEKPKLYDIIKDIFGKSSDKSQPLYLPNFSKMRPISELENKKQTIASITIDNKQYFIPREICPICKNLTDVNYVVGRLIKFCDNCKTHYIDEDLIGTNMIMIINFQTGNNIVVSEELYKHITNDPIPIHRIVQSSEDVIQQLQNIYLK